MVDIEGIQGRIDEIVSKARQEVESNSLGTAMYAFGLERRDSRIQPIYLDEFIKRYDLEIIKVPQTYSMAFFVETKETCRRIVDYCIRNKEELDVTVRKDLKKWLRPRVNYAGIVVDLNPTRIFHRLNITGKIKSNDAMDCKGIKRYLTSCEVKYCIRNEH
ncbi:hypothetical protein H6503_03205 [Candidatus Woesearchaeota archaeon]|nr:hypothetical protein [Candidatus Woesearchaeota archaeon]